MDIVGQIRFDGYVLDVYNDLDEPYFLAVQVAKLIDYSNGKTDHKRRALTRAEAKVSGIAPSTGDNGQSGKPTKWFVTELGLYNILSQSRKPIARKWRMIVHSNLIMMRRNNKLTILPSPYLQKVNLKNGTQWQTTFSSIKRLEN